MKISMEYLVVLVWSLVILVYAQLPTIITSDITENTTWTVAGSPYVIWNSIMVVDGVTLTIQPGVVVRFEIVTHLEVKGKLSVEGTAADSIEEIISNSNNSGQVILCCNYCSSGKLCLLFAQLPEFQQYPSIQISDLIGTEKTPYLIVKLKNARMRSGIRLPHI